MNIEQKKLHVFSVLVFVLLIFCFYILGGGTNVEEVELVDDTFNTSLPEANLQDLSETRLDAIYRAEELNDKQKRLETRQNNSFRWLIEEDSVSSEMMVAEDAPVEFANEEKPRPAVKPKPKRKKNVESRLSDRELFELEKQLVLERKRKELEEKLGFKTEPQSVKEQETKNSEIVVGKQKNKGFYGLTEKDIDFKPDIRALVHGEYKNIKTGAIVKFRIIDEFTINGINIPKNTFLFGQLSFRSGRAMINIENIQYNNMIIPFRASIYDQDGFEGLYTPDNMTDEAKRKMANDVIASTNLNVSGGIPFVTGATNAVTSAIKSISQSSVRDKKLSISSNYQVNIRYE
jgi:hypothetical protein